jgi:GNAT superfamily N-acetyltransferase
MADRCLTAALRSVIAVFDERTTLMPTLSFYHSTAELPPLVACQIQSFIRIVWYDMFKDDIHEPPLPDAWNPVYVVLGEEEAVFSHAGIVRQVLVHKGVTYNTYGLSSVFTYPGFRERGYGRQVVDAATTYIQQQPGADLALLFTGASLERFYGDSGWVHTPEITITKGDPQHLTTLDYFTMMLFCSEKGQQGRKKFSRVPLYIGPAMW